MLVQPKVNTEMNPLYKLLQLTATRSIFSKTCRVTKVAYGGTQRQIFFNGFCKIKVYWKAFTSLFVLPQLTDPESLGHVYKITIIA